MGPEAREQWRRLVHGQVEQSVRHALAGGGDKSEDLIDLGRLKGEELSGPNADRLARVAQEVGHRVLRFIEIYGGVFGFIVGIVQAAAYSAFSVWWTMPIVGAIVGLGRIGRAA